MTAGPSRAGGSRTLPATLVLSVGAHLGLGALLVGVPTEAAPPRASAATFAFEVAAPVDPTPAPPEGGSPGVTAPAPPPEATRAHPPRRRGPAPAPRAAAAPTPDPAPAPLDFSDLGALTAPGGAPAGAEFTGLVSGARGGVVAGPAPAAPGSRARPAGLPGRRWDCPWPARAEALDVSSKTVVLRATVGPDGRALDVDVVSDPGHGFGVAARRCALRARFQPALDAAGRPVRAATPPIRVRFVREGEGAGRGRLAAR